MKKIVIFAVRYSPNLGDGIISDCLENTLVKADPQAEIIHVDLAGRSSFGMVTVRNRGLALKILPHLPLGLRHWLVERILGRVLDRSDNEWREALFGADCAIIGGGQLFADADLNFPLKIARVAKLCRELSVPLSVYAVGVAPGWSPKGRALFSQLSVANLRHVAVRDIRSQVALRDQLDGLNNSVHVVPDPAVIAERHYGSAPTALSEAVNGRIGICITAETVLNYHADAAVAGGGNVTRLLTELIVELANRGKQIAVFTNGAGEDEQALETICVAPAVADLLAKGQLYRHSKFSSTTELVHAISAHDLIVAHRLHATIVAYAYKRPAIGLGWDQKLQSFFNMSGRSVHCISDSEITASVLCDRVEAALKSPIDPLKHREICAAADAGVLNLLTQIEA